MPTMRGWRWSVMPPARFACRRTWRRSGRSDFAAKRCRRLPQCHISRCARRARGLPAGTEVRVHGGAIASITEAGCPDGTRIDVEDLFYNLPARRKFLKSDAAEAGQISRIVSQLALGCLVGRVLARRRGTPRLRVPTGGEPPRAAVPDLRRCLRSDRGAEGSGRSRRRRLSCAAGRDRTEARAAERLHQRPPRPRSHHRARDRGRLQRGIDQGAQPRGSSLHRDAARRG